MKCKLHSELRPSHYFPLRAMSYLLPHLKSGWHVDQAILSEEERVVVLRFGRDADETCMRMDEVRIHFLPVGGVINVGLSRPVLLSLSNLVLPVLSKTDPRRRRGQGEELRGVVLR